MNKIWWTMKDLEQVTGYTEKRKKYEREQVKSVKANNKEGCVEVRFRNGELFKYRPDGTWY